LLEARNCRFAQDDLSINGHALEIRVYAEDPTNGFLPDIGTLTTYRRPTGPGVRVDDGFEEGMEIPIYYDPMIAKLIVHASTRSEAIKRMVRAFTTIKFQVWRPPLNFVLGLYNMKHLFREILIPILYRNTLQPDLLTSENDFEEKIAAIAALHVLNGITETCL
jgi:acetyl-CoA carboxylase biotin carboxylase subunit